MTFGFRASFSRLRTAGRVLGLIWFSTGLLRCVAIDAPRPYGLDSRPAARPYLLMPWLAGGPLPPLLSQTGVFKDVRTMTAGDALIPYDIIIPFWSDGAVKSRWVSIPRGKIAFSPTGEWVFPKGTVFVKTFELATNESLPKNRRRLETRLLVCDLAGAVYGVTYKWRADNSDADLLETNLEEAISIATPGGPRTQAWYYPSRQDCLTCHTSNAHFVLGVKARQLNRDFAYESGIADNELRAWNHIGLFEPALDEAQIAAWPRLARGDDTTRSLEDRARSFLDANCAHCHRPGGTVALFDARYDTPLADQKLISGRVLIDEQVDNPRLIAPNDIWRSILFMRADSVQPYKMPPLAHNEIDVKSMALVRQWIESLPGPPVLPPPEASPKGGTYRQPVEVTLKSEPGAVIHFTLNGNVPAESDPVYEKPIRLGGSIVLRARAFKRGYTKSIATQEIFAIGG